ncbi:MAG: DUF488 family protein [Promethearchaeota archaeon]
MKIWTIGHSTRSFEVLVSLLKYYNITILVDVRRFPSSKKFPHFNQKYLEMRLPEFEINYIWLGDDLGGFRKGGYAKYTKTKTFKEGVNKLLTIAKSGNTAIMCAEIVWFRCHRRWIADQLLIEGHEVIHIIDEKKTYSHKLRTEVQKN